MNATKFLLAGAAVLVGLMTSAAVIETKSGAKGDISILTPEIWTNDEKPSPGNDYLLTHEETFGGDPTTVGSVTLCTFPGDSLTVKGVPLLVESSYIGSRWLNFPKDGLILDNGSTFRYWGTASADSTVTVTGGCFTVKALVGTDEGKAPSIRTTAKGNQYTTTFAFRLPFKGPADALLNVNIYTATYNGRSRLEFDGDASEFYGTVKLLGNNHSVRLCGGRFGGQVRLTGDSALQFASGQGSDVCSIAKVTSGSGASPLLQLQEKASAHIDYLSLPNGTIEFPQENIVDKESGRYPGGSIEFTDPTSDLGSTAPIEIRFFGDNLVEDVVLVKAPIDAAAVTESNFTLTLTTGLTTGADDVELKVVEDENAGLRKLVLHRKRPLVFLLSTDSSDTHGSSFNPDNATNWSDRLPPHEGADYVVPASFQLMTVNPSSTFNGHALIVLGKLAVCGSNFYLGDESRLVLVGGSQVVAYGEPGVISGGKVETRKGTSASEVFIDGGTTDARTPQIDSELVGNWDLMFRHGNDSYNHEKNPFRLGGLNTNFLGRILTGTTYGGWKSGQNAYVFAVNDPRNLGGTLPSVEYSALKLTEAVRLRPTQSMSFTDVTRGVWIAKASAITVPEGTETDFRQQCTWQGELVKDGTGTLGLGGDLWFFTDTRTKEPPANGQTNRLSVVQGWVKPLAKESCDGLAFTFGADAGIRLTCGLAADDPVRTYGIYDVKWATPIATTSANATIPVAFDGERPVRDETVGVVTVRDRATADALVGRFTWTKTDNMNGTRVTFAVRDNADGTATVVSSVDRQGLMLIVR